MQRLWEKRGGGLGGCMGRDRDRDRGGRCGRCRCGRCGRCGRSSRDPSRSRNRCSGSNPERPRTRQKSEEALARSTGVGVAAATAAAAANTARETGCYRDNGAAAPTTTRCLGRKRTGTGGQRRDQGGEIDGGKKSGGRFGGCQEKWAPQRDLCWQWL